MFHPISSQLFASLLAIWLGRERREVEFTQITYYIALRHRPGAPFAFTHLSLQGFHTSKFCVSNSRVLKDEPSKGLQGLGRRQRPGLGSCRSPRFCRQTSSSRHLLWKEGDLLYFLFICLVYEQVKENGEEQKCCSNAFCWFTSLKPF